MKRRWRGEMKKNNGRKQKEVMVKRNDGERKRDNRKWKDAIENNGRQKNGIMRSNTKNKKMIKMIMIGGWVMIRNQVKNKNIK
jgi:hypothetical protein